MIEFREFTKDENRSMTHFCARCETGQKRFELHQCTPAPRWIAAKALMRASGQAAVVRGEPPLRNGTRAAVSIIREIVSTPELVSNEPVSGPVEEEHLLAANEGDDVSNDAPPVSKDRKVYMRELMRRKRAEAKG
jgi:hypothetical protein